MLPDREKMKTQMEALIYHFKIFTEGFTVRQAKSTRRRVAAWRTGLLHGQRRDREAVSRPHAGAQSSVILQALAKMCEGRLIADVIAHRNHRLRAGRHRQIESMTFSASNSKRDSKSC